MAGDSFTIILVDKVTVNANRASGAARKLNADLDKLTKPRKLEVLGLSALGTTLGQLGAKAIETAADIAIKLGEALMSTAEMASRYSMAFANVAGSQAAGNLEMQRSIRLAQLYGTTVEDTFKAIQQGQAMGFTEAQSRGVFKMGQDMKALGREQSSIDHIFYALRQIQAVGFMNRRESMMLGNAGVPLKKLYARIGMGMGLTGTPDEINEKVSKAISKRQVTANDAISSVGEVIMMSTHEKDLGEAGQKAANATIGGLEGRIRAQFEGGLVNSVLAAEPALVKGLKALFDGIKTEDVTGGFPAITDLLQGIGEFMQRIGPKLPEIANNFIKAFGAVSGLKIGSVDEIANAMPKIATAAGEFAANILKVVKAVAWVADKLHILNPDNWFASGLGNGGFNETSPDKYVRNKSLSRAEQRSLDPMFQGKDPDEGIALNAFDGILEQGGAAVSDDSFFAMHGASSPKETQRAPMSFDAIATAAANNINSSQDRSQGPKYQIGDIHTSITVQGSNSPGETARQTYDLFQDNLGSHLDGLMSGNGG